MKKIFLAILSAMLLFAACGKEDIVNDSNYLNDDVEIVFQSNFGTAPATKAIINAIDDLNTKEFNVFGYVHQVSNNPNISGGVIMNNANYVIVKDVTNASIYKATAKAGESYFWPKADDVNDIKVNFVAFYPTGNATKANDNTITYTIKADSKPTVDLTSDDNKDVLWATVYKVSPSVTPNKQAKDKIDPVKLHFRHALSLLEFKANVAGSNNITNVTITKIELLDVNKSTAKLLNEGTLTINLAANDDNTYTPATLYSTLYVPAYTATTTDASKKSIGNFVIAGNNDVFGTGYLSIPEANPVVLSNTIVLPQAVPQYVRITFDIAIKNGNTDEITYKDRVVTRNIRTDGVNPGTGTNYKDEEGKTYIDNWLAGYKYIYRFIISASEVEFEVEVEDWDDETEFLVWDKE